MRDYRLEDLPRLRTAQRAARRLAEEIVGRLDVGMTEHDAYRVARDVFRREGVDRCWHLPYIGVSSGSLQLRSLAALARARASTRRRHIRADDVVLVDIGPIIDGYPSDYTLTAVIGSHPAYGDLIAQSRRLTHAAAALVRPHVLAADLWRQVVAMVPSARGYELGFPPLIQLGHRIIPMASLLSRIPEGRLARLLLRRDGAFVARANRQVMDGLWAIEPYVIGHHRAAKHEVLVLVDGDRVVTVEDGPPPSDAAERSDAQHRISHPAAAAPSSGSP